ncbi:hypothetical protein [Cetobacterium somerae]
MKNLRRVSGFFYELLIHNYSRRKFKKVKKTYNRYKNQNSVNFKVRRLNFIELKLL